MIIGGAYQGLGLAPKFLWISYSRLELRRQLKQLLARSRPKSHFTYTHIRTPCPVTALLCPINLESLTYQFKFVPDELTSFWCNQVPVIVQLVLKFNISLASQSRRHSLPPKPVMNMSDDDCAIDYLLQTYGSVLHINSVLAKAEMIHFDTKHQYSSSSSTLCPEKSGPLSKIQ